MTCEREKIRMQTQLLDMQTDAYKCICNKVSAEKQENLKAHKEHNAIQESNMMSGCVTKLEDTLKLKNNESCIIIAVSKLQSIAFNCSKIFHLGYISDRN